MSVVYLKVLVLAFRAAILGRLLLDCVDIEHSSEAANLDRGFVYIKG
jgi:hypothetical protein